MAAILSMPKLTHVVPVDVVQPFISKDPPKMITTFKKERVNEGDVMFMIRSNDDRIAENINQYPRGVNVGTNLNFNNSTRFSGSNADARIQTKYVGSSVPGGVQHRLEFIPEKHFSLSRAPFRWNTEITGSNPAKPINFIDNKSTEYITKRNIVVTPQASKHSSFPCCGTARDKENVDDYYDLMQHCGFIIQDPLVASVTTNVKGHELNADVDINGIQDKMKQLLELNQHQNKTSSLFQQTDDVKQYTSPKINNKYVPIENIISKPFTIAIIDPESQHTINTRIISDKELRNLQLIASKTNHLTNNDIERVIGVNLKDKDTISIQSNGNDNVLYIAPTRIIPELQKLIPEYDLQTNMHNLQTNVDVQNRDVQLISENKPRITINDYQSHVFGGSYNNIDHDNRTHTIIDKNFHNRNVSTLKGNSDSFIPSNYRLGAIPKLNSKRLTK